MLDITITVGDTTVTIKHTSDDKIVVKQRKESDEIEGEVDIKPKKVRKQPELEEDKLPSLDSIEKKNLPQIKDNVPPQKHVFKVESSIGRIDNA